MKSIPRHQILLTLSAMICWILLYGAGLLLESIEHRIVLAPNTMKKQLGDSGKDLYEKVMGIPQAASTASVPVQAVVLAKVPADAATKTPTDATAKVQTAVPPTSAAVSSPTVVASHPKVEKSQAWAFFVAMFCYSPTNMAMLTLVAGFLGGCVSNAVLTTMEDDELKKLPERRLAFLCENPLSATMRGFVIYLCLVAGLYVAMDDPFKDSTPGQYARLAGSLSLVAFVVGYDPTRIEGWLRMAPGPQPSK